MKNYWINIDNNETPRIDVLSSLKLVLHGIYCFLLRDDIMHIEDIKMIYMSRQVQYALTRPSDLIHYHFIFINYIT